MISEPNDSIVVNTVIESKDTIFEENIFKTIPLIRNRILQDGKGQENTRIKQVLSLDASKELEN